MNGACDPLMCWRRSLSDANGRLHKLQGNAVGDALDMAPMPPRWPFSATGRVARGVKSAALDGAGAVTGGIRGMVLDGAVTGGGAGAALDGACTGGAVTGGVPGAALDGACTVEDG